MEAENCSFNRVRLVSGTNGFSAWYLYSCDFQNNATSEFSVNRNLMVLVADNCTLPDGGVVYNVVNSDCWNFGGGRGGFVFRNINRTPGLHKILTGTAVIDTQTSVRKTPSGYAWRASRVENAQWRGGISKVPLAKVSVKDGVQFSISLWVKITAVDFGIKMFARARQLSLTQPELSVEQRDTIDWVKKTITYTPNATGLLEFELEIDIPGGERASANYTGNIYWDDLEITL